MGKCGGRGLNSEGWTDRRPTSCAPAVLKVCTEMGMWAKKTSASNSSSSRAPSSHITASDLFEPLTIVPLKMVLDRHKQHAVCVCEPGLKKLPVYKMMNEGV